MIEVAKMTPGEMLGLTQFRDLRDSIALEVVREIARAHHGLLASKLAKKASTKHGAIQWINAGQIESSRHGATVMVRAGQIQNAQTHESRKAAVGAGWRWAGMRGADFARSFQIKAPPPCPLDCHLAIAQIARARVVRAGKWRDETMFSRYSCGSKLLQCSLI